ncbi:DUF3866 family protein [Brevibacillus humidisoli]|uniref:DUF3866 family protein n=1 Tax=Brevibacillus humidisoli TaxID=2895522 RepID=UPI001E288469|nr:DUF3866 family protein [Brevibacillus humidisoli]UFJ42877.1 DUF3866 family protein [Brevibacillus humidisoli]
MLEVVTGTVLSVVEEDARMQILEVRCGAERAGEQPERAIYFCSGKERCAAGDKVLLNVTAVRMGLGTGGSHFVIGRWTKRPTDYHPTDWGHIVKMRYSPWQLTVDAVEEQNSPWHDVFLDESRHLERTPVLIGELHSLLPFLVLTLKRIRPQARIVYVMPDGASLPIALSRHVRHLKQQGHLEATVTTGHAWGGDLEAVNLYTGLLAAKHVTNGQFILCILGPGVVGTGTPYGFSGMQLAEAIHAVSLLGGIPIYVPRISFSDRRSRHYGMSHHTLTLLKRFVLQPSLVPVPHFGDERDKVIGEQERRANLYQNHCRLSAAAPSLETVARVQRDYPESITTMGRGIQHDPAPLQTAYVAAQVADFCRSWADREANSSRQVASDELTVSGRQQQGASAVPPDRDELATLATLWACLTDGAE